MPRAPDFACREVAVNVHAVEFGEFFAVVNHAARQRPRFGMTVFDGGQNHGRRTKLAIEVKWMAAFVHAPTVVFTLSHQVGCFPKVLAVIADPDLTALLVNRQPPRVAQTVGPIFGSRIFQPDEWIVPRHRVGLLAICVVHINAKYAAVEFGQVLSRDPVVRIACSVTTGDVKHAVVAEHKTAAVMAH